ncbi:MAG: LOG family protein [archaeon]
MAHKKKYKSIGEILSKDHFRVSMFGSARIKGNDKTYKLIHELTRQLGRREINLVTGGGPGLMKAAHEGHHLGSMENDAYSIGLVIHLPNKIETENKVPKIKKDFKFFSARLEHFIALSNAVIVAPGGIGTLLELSYTWQLIQICHIYKIPVILFGEMWGGLIKWMKETMLKEHYIDKEDMEYIFIAYDVEDVLEIISAEKKEFAKGKKNLNMNLIKKKIRAHYFKHSHKLI